MPYSCAQIYALVNDIHSYPQFLPWCGGAKVLAQNDHGLTAEIIIAKGPVRMAFTTSNQLIENQQIVMQLIRGPFKSLDGSWQFVALTEDSCSVTLRLAFDFNNKLLAVSVGAVFEQVMTSLVDAFLKRANELYGRSNSNHHG